MINEINIINNREIDISKDLWLELNKNYDKTFIKKMISDTIAKNNLELPYRKITLDEAKNDFQRLLNLDTNNLLIKGVISFLH